MRVLSQIKELQSAASAAKREGREDAFQSIKQELDRAVKDMKEIR
jgi:hypothetical protein